MTERERVLEFLRAFINGGVNQDFTNWAETLYREMQAADAAFPRHTPDCKINTTIEGSCDCTADVTAEQP